MFQRINIQEGMEENTAALYAAMLELTQNHAGIFLGKHHLSQFKESFTRILENMKTIHRDVVRLILENKNHPSLNSFVRPVYNTVKSNFHYYSNLRTVILSIKDEATARFLEDFYPFASLQRLEIALKAFIDELESLIPALKYMPDTSDKQELLRLMVQSGEMAEMATAASGEKITKAERMSNLLVLFKVLNLFEEGPGKRTTSELAEAAIKIVDASLDYAKDCVEAFRSKEPTRHSKTTIGIFIEGSLKWLNKLLRL